MGLPSEADSWATETGGPGLPEEGTSRRAHMIGAPTRVRARRVSPRALAAVAGGLAVVGLIVAFVALGGDSTDTVSAQGSGRLRVRSIPTLPALTEVTTPPETLAVEEPATLPPVTSRSGSRTVTVMEPATDPPPDPTPTDPPVVTTAPPTTTTTLAPTAPGAPTTVAATAGTGTATVTWVTPASDGGSAITGYVIQYSLDGGAWVTVGPTGSTALTFDVTGLSAGSYVFQVAAVNTVGTGVWSASSTATIIV